MSLLDGQPDTEQHAEPELPAEPLPWTPEKPAVLPPTSVELIGVSRAAQPLGAGALVEIAKPLMRSAVKKRKGAGGKWLNYVEAWHVKAEANRVFGYDGWDAVTRENVCIVRESFEKVDEKTGELRKGVRVTYKAIVDMKAGGCVRSGSGFGDGISYGEEGPAHEMALKEAESDALKRAANSFGDRFGLVLYDKDRRAG